MIPILEEDPQALPTLTAVYDSEISFADFYIGELCQRFKLDKNTLIIITADHGAEFLEHGQIGHGNNLFKETTQIPFIMKLPNSSQKKVDGKTTNLVDIMPTILNILNVNPPEQTLGKSLSEKKGKLSWLKKIFLKEEKPEYCFSELDVNSILKAIVTPEWKYIYDYNGNVEQLYHIKQDPLELNDLRDTHTKQADQLKEQLFQWVSNSKKYHGRKRMFNLSPGDKEKLEAMGYLDTQEMKVDQ
jgi:arylsulfatase